MAFDTFNVNVSLHGSFEGYKHICSTENQMFKHASFVRMYGQWARNLNKLFNGRMLGGFCLYTNLAIQLFWVCHNPHIISWVPNHEFHCRTLTIPPFPLLNVIRRLFVILYQRVLFVSIQINLSILILILVSLSWLCVVHRRFAYFSWECRFFHSY